MSNTKKIIGIILITLLVPVGLLFGFNWYLSVNPLPEYGTWTGIQPLESKLRKYEAFAKRGKVDAVIISSSIGDRGISAETFSKEMSAKLGREYRAFNFSVGGAEFRTYHSIYQILRTVAAPSNLYIFHPAEQALREQNAENGPDHTMAQAPIGESLKNPAKLPMSRYIWSFPIVSQSSALRDLLLHGDYKNRKPSQSDVYTISEYGDSLSYSRIGATDTLPSQTQGRENSVLNLMNLFQQKNDPDERRKVLLSDTDFMAGKKVKELADSDGCKITLVAHDQAVGSQSKNPKYLEANKTYFDEVAKLFGINAVNFLDQFVPHNYEIEDGVHLNVHGAKRFAQAFFAALNNQKYTQTETYNYSDQPIDASKDSTMSNWVAIILRSGTESGKTLEATYMQTWQTPAVETGSAVILVLRKPDKSDIFVPATVTAPGVVRATFDNLPSENAVYYLRLVEQVEADKKVAINAPLASYRWLKE